MFSISMKKVGINFYINISICSRIHSLGQSSLRSCVCVPKQETSFLCQDWPFHWVTARATDRFSHRKVFSTLSRRPPLLNISQLTRRPQELRFDLRFKACTEAAGGQCRDLRFLQQVKVVWSTLEWFLPPYSLTRRNSPLRSVQTNDDRRARCYRRLRQFIQKSILPEGGEPEQVQGRRETSKGVPFRLADDWWHFVILYDYASHTYTCSLPVLFPVKSTDPLRP
jgi:hypothetical protein